MDDETTGRLLRLGGMRTEVPPDRESRVRRAVLDECRAVARARVVGRRRLMAAGMLSFAAAAVVAVRVWLPREASPATVIYPPADVIVATVERLEGTGGQLSGRSASTPPTPIGLADALRAGHHVETGAAGRVGLRLSQHVSLRFDHRSRVRLLSANAIELSAGAVYVDSGPESPDFEVHTSFGVVRDIGTQFELRLSASSLRVRVRSGVVEVQRGGQVSSARPGTELMLGPAGATNRDVEPYGSDWAWAAGVGPTFAIEGRALGAFLEHLCREQGWRLVYADGKLALEASGMILHGSTAGLQASDALAIALATTGLTHRLKDGELMIARGSR